MPRQKEKQVPNIPTAHISHLTSWRMRVKILSKKGDDGYFRAVKNTFSKLKGIERVEINALTGSILFIHKTDKDTIIYDARTHQLFEVRETTHQSPLNSTVLSRNVSETFKKVNNRIKEFTSEEMDAPGLAFLSLLGLGVYQIGKGNIMAPAWYIAFWYALNIFLHSQSGKAGTEK